MNTIFKYPLEEGADGSIKVKLPFSADILSAQIQRGRIVVWALIWGNPCARTTIREFKIVGTGFTEDLAGWRYISTVQDGDLVWHVFER